VDDRTALGDFLRRRREGLTPVEAGLPARPTGRTPGLRREEVAALATVSTTYYERLEQGRGPRPSTTVLASLSTALHLTPDEEAHLFRLAGFTPPLRDHAGAFSPPRSSPRALPRALPRSLPRDHAGDSSLPRDQAGVFSLPQVHAGMSGDGRVDPGLAYVLEAVGDTTPAFITDELGTVLAQNWLNETLFGRFVGLPGLEANLIWQWFMSPTWRHKLDPPEQQGQTGFAYVADLRAVLGQRDRIELVERLLSESPEFRTMWDRHPVAALHCTTKVVNDERVGRLDFDCSIIASPVTRQRILTMQPVAGTPTASRVAALTSHRPAP
jgi:transcriptional regulator with XRE-family HTH domain